MTSEIQHVHETSGNLLSGFHFMIALWGWCLVVGLHGLWRSVGRSDPDPIRPSGPV